MKFRILAIVALTFFSSISVAETDDWEAKYIKKHHLRENTRGNKPREHVVDPYLVERKKQRSSFSSRCDIDNFKTMGLYEACSDEAMNEYRTKYPDRGTDGYGEKFYAPLSREEGKVKRDELLKLLDWVSFYPKFENEDIELTVPDIRSEIMYIERYVMQIPPRSYETR
ncbi:MAG: hypothetical protein CMD81_08070 [Gammaproteobacteria bacterium]|mgnify:FL=1|nr:hypothetical protein [Gammaproteobacteria bacterium]MBK82275.1 hypothetical protein [Gammaproteobacteria bacterium]MBK83772.1 hypothetical protein [Gammaproteobacteria bacterium]|tara:strand:- start:12564 stop:13070 length:507 start_codon:yes stop_codon:yes gene_type:complete